MNKRSGTQYIGCEYCFYKIFNAFFEDLPQGVHTCTCNSSNQSHDVCPDPAVLVDEPVQEELFRDPIEDVNYLYENQTQVLESPKTTSCR